MPWSLSIHIIDVGQGESSLIDADNGAGQRRTMLIDGGEAACAETLHDYVSAVAPAGVSHFLVSHYDDDHSGGIQALLIADNLYHICDVIAQAAAAEANAAAAQLANNGRINQIAAGAAGAYAAMLGAYGGQILQQRVAAQATYRVIAAAFDDTAAKEGIKSAEAALARVILNASIIPQSKRKKLAQLAGIAAADAIAAVGNVVNLTRDDVFASLQTTVPAGSRFQTGGIYAATHVIDIGDTAHVPGAYAHAVGGRFAMSANHLVQAPGIARQRTSNPNLAAEILWSSGPAAVAAPASSPAVFVMACRKYVWRAPNNAVPIASGQPDNDDSIGLVLRFNNFFYYTGGDLPAAGEELVATAVMATGLPDPQAGGAFALPHRIACFKCGHHGAATATSQTFLNTAVPRGAFISCGYNVAFRHPAQGVIDRLNGFAYMRYFYLTNCKFVTNHVPASNGVNTQLTAANNWSRVAGDNADNNLAAGRQRGDIRISLSQAESSSNVVAPPLAHGAVLRQYHVRYFEEDAAVNALRIEDTVF